jgi:hypothetical protein
LVKRPYRQRRKKFCWFSMQHVSFNARAISAGELVACAGSGTPQCAVIGWPGYSGHASAAALSHTVNTKSNCGVPGAMNSSHDFERKPDAS